MIAPEYGSDLKGIEQATNDRVRRRKEAEATPRRPPSGMSAGTLRAFGRRPRTFRSASSWRPPSKYLPATKRWVPRNYLQPVEEALHPEPDRDS